MKEEYQVDIEDTNTKCPLQPSHRCICPHSSTHKFQSSPNISTSSPPSKENANEKTNAVSLYKSNSLERYDKSKTFTKEIHHHNHNNHHYRDTEKTWNLNEIARHSTSESAWLIVDSKVYDVTSFIKCHPGGPSPILKKAGGDATSDFYAHSILAQRIWKSKMVVVGKISGDSARLLRYERLKASFSGSFGCSIS